jgi:hypothetical protein
MMPIDYFFFPAKILRRQVNVILNIDVGNAIVRDCGCFKGACVNSQLAVVKEITPFMDLLSSQSCMSSR